MPTLEAYQNFDGRHWESGSVHNYFAYRGVKAPHTGQPYSEAFFMGVSGGAVMGYFSFVYEGHDPQVRILTRNTFDPLDRMLERLGIVQNRVHTTSSKKAVTNLMEMLQGGEPAITWADMYRLPYNALPPDEAMWAMLPVLVYGFEPDQDQVWIADRAKVPLQVTIDDLAQARGRVKKDKHRLLTLDPPNPDKLSAAVQQGIWDCIQLYTQAPPKGASHNFGLAAFEHWAQMLVHASHRLSWAKIFPPGRPFFNGLLEAYKDIRIFGKGPIADRDLFAGFLDEAAVLLENERLKKAAESFRGSIPAWEALAEALLSDVAPPFAEARGLLLEEHDLFLEQGAASLDRRIEIKRRLEKILELMEDDYPLDETEHQAYKENLRASILSLREKEARAVTVLQEAMA